MEKVIYGNLNSQGLEVVIRHDRYFVRYDAGAHMVEWREDEITESEFHLLKVGGKSEEEAMFEIQRRLEKSGINPYVQNWVPQ